MIAMPSPGAVWPAMVRLLAQVTALARVMVPPTSKTIKRFPLLDRVAERTRAAVGQSS
jgi:hypothetical protein